MSNWLSNFFKSQFGHDFLNIDAIWYFLLNFLKWNNDFSPKLTL